MKRVKEDDEKILRRKRMRLRFKRLVRSVVMNIQFLDETDEAGISMNVKKNVAFLVRQKRKTGILTVAEKSLLRSAASRRTIEDRKKLCMIVANLTCFGRIPPKLRARLVPHLKFQLIHADRVIIRENNIPLYLYFVISGEIEMKKSIYDKNGKRIGNIAEAIIGPGDWLGEVEILEHCLRLNTYVTISQCEILSITEEVFMDIVGPFMKKQWQEKKLALKSLNYFDHLTESQIVHACSNCQLMQFDPLESIFSDTRGALHCVHFILSGECVILQCLKMKVLKKKGKTIYELYYVPDSQGYENDKPLKSIGSSFENVIQETNMLLDNNFNLQDILASSFTDKDKDKEEERQVKHKAGIAEIEAYCQKLGFDKSHHLLHQTISKQRSFLITKIHHNVSNELSVEEEDIYHTITDSLIEECIEELITEITDWSPESDSLSVNIISQLPSRRENMPQTVREPSIEFITPKFSIHNVMTTSTDTCETVPFESSDSSDSTPMQTIRTPQDDIETHFIEVGVLTYGAIFGLGEKMTHRVIMARTNVQCLLLPRYWLMEEDQNPGHVWQRRKFYLENCIPSREELFRNFLKTRCWDKFKEDLIQSTLNPNSVNSTHPEDIPIMSRIVELRDDN